MQQESKFKGHAAPWDAPTIPWCRWQAGKINMIFAAHRGKPGNVKPETVQDGESKYQKKYEIVKTLKLGG